MSKEQEIQEMARVVCTDFAKIHCNADCAFKTENGGCFYANLCKELYEHGYRKVDDVATAIYKELFKTIHQSNIISWELEEYTINELINPLFAMFGVKTVDYGSPLNRSNDETVTKCHGLKTQYGENEGEE